MSYNTTSITVLRRALNRRNPTPLYDVGCIGQCSGQTVGTVVRYTIGTISNAGRGPAADFGQFILNNGAQSVTIASAAPLASEAYSALSVYHLYGTGTGTITITGTPRDSYLLLVQIVATGTNSTATLKYSLDDGMTWSTIQTSQATIALSCPDGTTTGLTLTMTGSAGAFVANEVYALALYANQIDTTAGNTGSITDCENKLSAFGDYSFVMLTNPPQHSTDSANLTAYSSQLSTLYTLAEAQVANGKLQRIFSGLPRRISTLPALQGLDSDATFAGLVTTNVTALDDRLSGISAGYVLMQSQGAYYVWRPAAWVQLALQMKSLNPQKSGYRWADGHIATFITTPATTSSYTIQDYTQRPLNYGCTYDEALSVSTNTLGLLGPAGFLTLTSNTRMNDTTVALEKQFAFTACNAHTQTNSDFFEMQYGILADVVLRAILDGMAKLHGEFLETRLDGTVSLTDKAADMAEAGIVSERLDPLVKKTYLRPIPSDKKYINIHRDNNVINTGILFDVYCPVGVYGRVFQGTFQLMA